MVLQYALEPNILIDEEHALLDRQVIEAHLTYLSKHSFPGSIIDPVGGLSCLPLLATIVKYSNGLLDSKYMTIENAGELLGKDDNLGYWLELLRLAWHHQTFRDFRNMDILRAPHASPSSPPRLYESFRSKYLGDAALGFLAYLKEKHALFVQQGTPMYYGKFCSIVQSSGTGKSRLMTEMSNVGGIIVLYMNLNPTGDPTGASGFPLCDQIPWDILVTGLPAEEKHYYARCCAFFAAIFRQLEEEFRHRLQNKKKAEIDKAIQTWNDGMNDVGIESFIRKTFFNNVNAKYKQIFAAGRSPAGRRADEVLIDAYRSMIHNLSSFFKMGDRPKLIIAIDEAHPLSQVQGSYRPADTICRVIGDYSHIQHTQVVWVVFASTTSKVADFSPPNHIHNSQRVAFGGQLLFPPYTAMGWNHKAREMSSTSAAAEDVALFHHIASFGRPLWAHDLLASPDRVLRLASTKLLGSVAFRYNSGDQALAILGQRFALEVALGHPESAEFLETSVASHLRFCHETTEDRIWKFTGYPSEPLLSCAAANILHAHPDNLSACLRHLQSKVNSGMIEKGQRGELASRLLWLLSKDLYLRQEGSIDFFKESDPDISPDTSPGTPDTPSDISFYLPSWKAKLADCDMVPVVDWLEYVFGGGFWMEEALGKAREVFADAYVNFSHWVCMEASIAGTEADPGMPIDEWSLHLWRHTAAVQCCHHQRLIDKVIPIYFKDTAYGSSDQVRMSQIFISDKARKKDSKKDLSKITRTAVARRTIDRDKAVDGPPYIAILVDLGLNPSEPTVDFGEVEGERSKCLRIYAGGVDETVYPFLKSHPESAKILQDFAHLPETLDNDGATVQSLKDQAKFGATSTPKHIK